MNRAHAIWTLQPNGFADKERTTVRLSLVVSLRAVTDSNRLDGLPEWLDWPAQVRVFDTVNVFVDGRSSPVAARVVSAAPRSDLWQALFRPDTRLDLAGGGDVAAMRGAGSSVLFKPVTETLRAVYAPSAGGTAQRAAGPGGGGLAAALAGLTQWSTVDSAGSAAGGAAAVAAVQDEVAHLLHPAGLTAAGLAEAGDRLRARGLTEAAAVLPLVPLLRRLRGTPPPAAGGIAQRPVTPTPPVNPVPPPAEPPGPLDATRSVDEADFHQVLGLVSAQPALALALGLRFDLTMPAVPGRSAIRTSGLPWQVAGGRPWSQVDCDPATGRFTMAAQPGAPTEMLHGMLDLRADGPGAERYVLTTMDVVGTAAQLDVLARAVRSGTAAAGTLPPRRSTGITLAQVDRRATTVTHTVDRGVALAAGFGEPEAVDPAARAARAADPAPAAGQDGEVELYADDVTAGYRVDVRPRGGRWQSLMRRLITYRVGAVELPVVDDEGMVDPVVAVQQRDTHGTPRVEVGEDLFTWDGYGLAARRPGPSVTVGAAGPRTEAVPRGGSEHFPVTMDVAQKPGTLPRLRFGGTYELRVRGVDLAYNSIDPEVCDPAQVSAPVRYRRLEPVDPPAVVPRAPFTAGESQLRLVVRSDGKGNPIGGSCERHLAAPKTGQHIAEQHGLFDDAFGPQATAAARDRALAVAALEAGSFTDATVPDPADPTRRVPSPGVRVAVNADAGHPPTATLAGLARGQALPAGEYVVLDTDDALLPYFADPLAAGVAVAGLSGARGAGPAVARFGNRWPSPTPVRLVARPGKDPQPAVATPTGPSGRQSLEITVPPAATLTTQLSSTLTDGALDVMEADLPAAARPAAQAGQEPLLTPAQAVTIVHAVQRPLQAPVVTAAAAKPRVAGDTAVDVAGSMTCHPASTARVDVVASWSETVDDGESPLVTEKRTATAGSVTVAPGAATVPWQVRQSFGDTRRYDVAYSGVGSSRFREYFPGTPAEDMRLEGPGLTTVVPSTARPDVPEVHSVVPLFGWDRSVAGGVLTSTRRTVGLRVWLERPWCRTGPGERLAVLVYHDQASGEKGKTMASVHQHVTRWAGDPLDGWGKPAPHLTAANFPGTLEVSQPPAPVVTHPPTQLDGLGHEVFFDEARDKWFADVLVDLARTTYFPFLRLAVARHQPQSAPGCHLSPVVVCDPVQLPATRTLTAKLTAQSTVDITVTGPWTANTRFEATLYTRAPDPLAAPAATDLFARAQSPHGNPWMLTAPQFEDTITVTGSIPVHRMNNPSPDLLAGRIVVRELQVGDSLHGMGEGPQTQPAGAANRALWLESVDVPTLKV